MSPTVAAAAIAALASIVVALIELRASRDRKRSEARAERRMKELLAKGVETDFDQVLQDILRRDEQDMNREVAPLRQAEDAVRVDTTELDFDQSFQLLCSIIRQRMEEEA